jgi:hypothetical protein
MSRADSSWSSRFDSRFELDNIWTGMQNDLSVPFGQIALWFSYDAANTHVDALFDVGSYAAGGGRMWKSPVPLKVVNAIKLEGSNTPNDQGRYTFDSLRLIFSADQITQAGLRDVILNPNQHLNDRMVFENKVFEPNNIRVRGIVYHGYATVAVDADQVKREEMVNDDPQFHKYISLDQT